MPTYTYKARDKDNKLIVGTIDSQTEESAANLLSDKGLVPTGMVVKEKFKGFDRLIIKHSSVSLKTLMIFSKELSIMISAGIPIARAFKTLVDEEVNLKFSTIIAGIAKDIEDGEPLHKSFQKYPDVFPSMYISAVKAGEASGSLDRMLIKLSDQLESDYETILRIRSAMAYPIFILAVLVFTAAVVTIWVLPQIKTVFDEASAQLPLITRIILSISDIVRANGISTILILGILVYFLRLWMKTDKGKITLDNMKLVIPVFNNIYKKVYMDHFTGTLATLLSGGLPILESLDIVADGMNNRFYKESILRVRDKIKDGATLSKPLREDPLFPKMIPQMIAIGEETGKIDEILLKLSKFYHSEVDNTIKGASSLIEPIMLLLIGVGVGFLVATIILPIYNLSQVF
ncbi:hypothetical protein A2Y27_03745 [candidate division CPR2 bacterium GWD1_39_7]|nr:MAG: pilin biogenesis protein [candidate division CPR2 bacterium GW2011_GWD1_39_7]OGB61435.1 MAG: hypothetical protein A2Y27_03745 [candidate division CPR2 bacterium GWD1_39_7]